MVEINGDGGDLYFACLVVTFGKLFIIASYLKFWDVKF